MLRNTDAMQIDVDERTLFFDPTKKNTSDIDTDVCSCPTTCCSTDESSLGDCSLENSESSHRRVTFDADENGRIIEYNYIYPKNESLGAYTTNSEESENERRIRRDCRHLKKRNKELIHRMNDIYENQEYQEDANIFNEWDASDLRGFESYFLTESAYQIQAYVQLTMLHYRHLRNIFDEAEPCDKIMQCDIDEILRRRMIRESERSRQLAIRLAAADEINSSI